MITTSKPIRETSPLLPTLSTRGWVSGMDKKVDLILSYYITSQHHQTLYHLEHVKSLQYSIKISSSTPSILADYIKSDLETLLRPYVDFCEVTVTYQKRATGPEVDYTIVLNIIHQGFKWDVKRTMTLNNSELVNLIEINKTGMSLVRE